jgi:hypothetical protein
MLRVLTHYSRLKNTTVSVLYHWCVITFNLICSLSTPPCCFQGKVTATEMLYPIILTLFNNNLKQKQKTWHVYFPPALKFQNLGYKSSQLQTNLSIQSTWKSGMFLCDTASCKLRTTSCTVAVFPVPGTPLMYMHLEYTQLVN